jgi:hypothetical protein
MPAITKKGHQMKHTFRLAVAGAGLLLGVQAGAGIALPQTNVVQNINIVLTAYSQGDTVTNGAVISRPVFKVKKTNKDIILALGTATTNIFSTKSKLILVTGLVDTNSTVYVVDGTNRIDVSSFFSYDSSGSTDIQSYQTNMVNHLEKSTDYTVAQFAMQDADGMILPGHFQAVGLSTVTAASVVKSGVILGKARQIAMDLNGVGDFKDDTGVHDLVVHVTITITGNTVVVE